MQLLLDTHILLWWLGDPARLEGNVRHWISHPENAVLISTATLWELRMKERLGKLHLPSAFDQVLDESEFGWLPISRAHANATAHLPPHHSDPFDRMLVAQAQVENLTLITSDARVALYGKNIWLMS